MNLNSIVLSALLALGCLSVPSLGFAQTNAIDGGGSTGGGTGLIIQFEYYIQDFQRWVLKNHLSKIDSAPFSSEQMEVDILDASNKVLDHKANNRITIEFVNHELKSDGKIKTCVNTPSQSLIQCNVDRWNNFETEPSRFVTAVHEIFGIKLYEKNEMELSNAPFSRQLFPYLTATYKLSDEKNLPQKSTSEDLATNFVLLHPDQMTQALKKAPNAEFMCYPKVKYLETIEEPTQCLDCEEIRKREAPLREAGQPFQQTQAMFFSTKTKYIFTYTCETPNPDRFVSANLELIETRINAQANVRFEYETQVNNIVIK